MGLHWNLTRIDYNAPYWTSPERNDDVTTAIIWLTMSAKVADDGLITEKNAPEFFARVYAWERSRGAMLRVPTQDGEGMEPRYITWDDVRAHVGLYTNVFPALSRRRFVTKLVKVLQSGGFFPSEADHRPAETLREEVTAWLNMADRVVAKAKAETAILAQMEASFSG